MAEQRKFGRLIYLASPYTHTDKEIEVMRYRTVLAAWQWLMDNRRELHFFSPIVLSHQCVVGQAVPGDWKFWADFDSTMISKCDEFWILCVNGFRESVGINAERQIATELGLPVKFLVQNSEGGYDLAEVEP